MTGYKPQSGDRVRATNGENVLVGEVIGVDARSIDVIVDEIMHELGLYYADGWSFERVVDPVVFKPLAVVRLADDALEVLDEEEQLFSDMTGMYENLAREFVRTAGDYWHQYDFHAIELEDSHIERLLAAGKAEVLFEGVDAE